METSMDIQQRNAVLKHMAHLLQQEKEVILAANKKDLSSYNGNDISMHDRLKVDNAKIEGMILSLHRLIDEPDPLNIVRSQFLHDNGITVSNRTAPFGTICIIYESRPDVTIEAAGIAFKSGNKILLKGGKESLQSNLVLVDLWHRALLYSKCPRDWMTYLRFSRAETQAFLQNPTQKIDLIVPRGGEKLIRFVKRYASCPVIISGRGNNFIFIDTEADTQMALKIIINAKTSKISACNALDKVLISADMPKKEAFVQDLVLQLKKHKIQILTDRGSLGIAIDGVSTIENESIWHEEFLDYKILIGQVKSLEEGIQKINTYGGGHSAAIVTANDTKAGLFMNTVDCAAVYHNASTRFTDGGQFGLGGELAISTDKLHQRGPIGLEHLVTNKWFIKGNGQVR